MTTICAFSVAMDNRARAAPIRHPGFLPIGPNLSGYTNGRPALTHSVGPRLDWRAPGLLGPLDAKNAELMAQLEEERKKNQALEAAERRRVEEAEQRKRKREAGTGGASKRRQCGA
ncbi:hypothetical protein FN846DRAFT_896592 [Sphaerosporella brunnea]|uniref:Uncharacterized protein n=1 Tax=Sphaerosporella brunnea TaxID=1250544 RepID=A0A5J5ECG5_9PEZI|nr:hypothetical protein FN846DRAFT_896592 [Sphaerosporella brunnea]